MIVQVYSDTSHCEKTRIAACGFVALSDGKLIKHHVKLLSDVSGAYQGEFIAGTDALQYAFLLSGVTKIVLHTDCLALIIQSRYANKRKRSKPMFITEYIETIETINECGVEVECIYVEGHADDDMNNYIDQSVRYQLRNYIKTKHINGSKFKHTMD